MRIYHNNLGTTLNQGVKPVWLIFGDEPWQKNNALETIKAHSLQQGYDELLRFSLDEKSDWFDIHDAYHAMSLFSSQRIIEIELEKGKIGDQGSKAVITLAENIHPDVQLIIHGPKLDAASQKRKWFKTLENIGCFLPIYDIEGKHLQQWLANQARTLNLNLHQEVIPHLTELFEGNLPALEQELQKLAILFGQQAITPDTVEDLLINQTKFSPFQLIDTLLSGNIKKCMLVLEQLQHENAPAGQIIWFLHKEIKQLLVMQEQLKAGHSQADIFKKFRVWDKKKPLYQHALRHASTDNLNQALARIAQVDLISKTNTDFNTFQLLADVCATFYHGDITSQFSLAFDEN